MGIAQDGGTKFFPAGWNVEAKPCDYCKSAAALLFCRNDSAFMCIACDAKVHNSNNKLTKHARVWMCEVCEQAPASVTCKADAASLCVACDRDIHAANPLARRHERVAVVPFYDTAESMVIKSTLTTTFLEPISESNTNTNTNTFVAPPCHEDRKSDTQVVHDLFPDSWIASKLAATDGTHDIKSMDFLFSDSDQFLEFDNYQIPSSQPYADSVVPVQTAFKSPAQARTTHNHSPENRFEIDFSRSNISYTAPSLSHSMSSSSMDVGIVPDGSTMSETSYPFVLNGNQSSQVVGMDREARVLRYREKRKNRKFEKTIRYASRKAYAETRPRIKGRFAKRNETDQSDIDRIFGADLIAGAGYGVVPSF